MPAAVHIRGDYAVFPELQGRVTVLDKDGAIVAQVGDNPNAAPARQLRPARRTSGRTASATHRTALRSTRMRNLLVAEWTQFGRLHKFTRVP